MITSASTNRQIYFKLIDQTDLEANETAQQFVSDDTQYNIAVLYSSALANGTNQFLFSKSATDLYSSYSNMDLQNTSDKQGLQIKSLIEAQNPDIDADNLQADFNNALLNINQPVTTTAQGSSDAANGNNSQTQQAPVLVPAIGDLANDATKNLLNNLYKLGQNKQTLFGHHDDLMYGRDWYLFNYNYKTGNNAPLSVLDALKGNYKSDTLVGNNKQYPAVFSWDLGGFDESYDYYVKNTDKYIINGVRPTDMVAAIKWAYKKGSVNTICWHCSNPLNRITYSEKDKKDNAGKYLDKNTVKEILSDSSDTQKTFNNWLKNIVSLFQNQLKDIPIIFRPFHENNLTNTFWWDKQSCSDDEDFKALWRHVFNYFKNQNINNVLFCYSINDPNENNTFNIQNLEDTVTNRLAGYAFIDILGLDSYLKEDEIKSNGRKLFQQRTIDSIAQLSSMAATNKKVAILSEFGMENDPVKNKMTYPDWWVKEFANILKTPNVPIVTLWRNPTINKDPGIFYSVFPTDTESVKYFVQMLQTNTNVLMLDKVSQNKMYK
jgi:mannan endo-1,4-beta-mannosidase